jgi:uncharacterized lipoprotein YmbA
MSGGHEVKEAAGGNKQQSVWLASVKLWACSVCYAAVTDKSWEMQQNKNPVNCTVELENNNSNNIYVLSNDIQQQQTRPTQHSIIVGRLLLERQKSAKMRQSRPNHENMKNKCRTATSALERRRCSESEFIVNVLLTQTSRE